MHIYTILFCHLIPVSLTLALVGDDEVSAKQNLLASIFLHAFELIRVKFDLMLKQFKLKHPDSTLK